MRNSGSLKSIIHGITTDKAKLADPRHLKEQVNMQTVIGSGLHKRPPLEVLALDVFPTYVNDSVTLSYVKSFTIRSVEYLLMVQLDATDISTVTDVRCAKLDGTAVTLTETSSNYFGFITSADDIGITVQEDRVFVFNKKVSTAMLPDLKPTQKTSLLHIKTAPLPDTSVTVSFTDTASTTFTIIHPVGTAASGRGTDVVAAAIRDAVNATAAVGVTAVARGSVIAFTRTDNDYAEVSVEDDLGGQAAVAINGQMADVNDLPKYISGEQVLKIQPQTDTNRGVFYMESEVDAGASAPTVPASDGEFVSGTDFYNPDTSRYNSGVQTFSCSLSPGVGTWVTKPTPGSIQMESCLFKTNLNGTGLHYLQLNPCGGGGAIGWVSGTIGRVSVRRKSDLALVFDQAVTVADEATWGTGVYYNIPINPSVTLSSGTSYYIYINKVISAGSTMSAVNWKESSAPGEQFKFNAASMPHSLTHTNDTDLRIDPIEWDDKQAGDDESSPQPAFIGNPLNDLAIFQNRVIALYRDEVVTTETDNTQSWFRSTVTQLLATHPVRMRSTAPETGVLTHALYHNRDLVLFSSKRQFKLSGDIPLTPETSGLPITTSYANDSQIISPASVGTNLFFAFNYGKYLGISQFKADENDALVDRADPTTDHVRTFISGSPLKFLGDANTGELYMITREGTIYVLDYDTKITRQEDIRWAWSKWTDFAKIGGWNILEANLVQRDIVLTLEKGSIVTTVKLDTVEDPNAATLQTYLDFLVKDIVSAGTITLDANYPYTSELLVTVIDPAHNEYGNIIEYTESGGVLTVDTAYNGVDVGYGFPFRASMKPNTIFIRDEGGFINSFTRLTIQQWLIHLNRSADVYAKIISDYYDGDDQYWSGLISGDINTQTDKVADNTSVFKVSFKQRADLADLELYSEGHLPWSITQVEYLGNYSSRGRRF